MSLKKEIILLLENYAALLEFKGDNPFKINAFRNGANIVRSLDDEIETQIKSGEIINVKGLGKGLLAIIYDYFENGYSTDYESLVSEVPSGILDLLKINGLGAKKIKAIYTELDISNLADLETACRLGKIASLKGFGAKTQEAILKEIDRIKSTRDFILLNIAKRRLEAICEKLEDFKSVKKITAVGEYRRALEVISKLELLLEITNREDFEKELSRVFVLKNSFIIEEATPSLSGFHLPDSKAYEIEFDNPVILYAASSKKDFEVLLFHTTGSQEFISSINSNNHQVVAETVNETFNTAEFPFIIPEMREALYFEAKTELRENSRLTFNDFKGLLHFHTTASDGQNTLEEMITSAKSLGFQFAAVCDHSKAAFYANGLHEDQILRQKEEIKDVSMNLSFPVLQGVESDILKDGSLDYPDDFLSVFDFIVASVHSSFKLTEEEMTERIIKAVENPYTDLLGHPTGRLLLSRDSYQLNIRKVIDACAANRVAIEINANPLRLDLDWRMIYYAREKGCMFSINPDAHSTSGIEDIHFGIRIARKGGLQPVEVINCFELSDFQHFLNRKVKRGF